MDERTNGNSGKRQCVAGLDVRIGAGDDGLANIQAARMKDVALFAVCVVKQCDARRTIRIVFDGGNFSGDTVLVALEIDYTITALHAAALVAGGDAAVVVTTSLLGQRTQKRLFRSSAGDVSKIGNSLEAPPGLVGLYCLTPIFFPFYGHEPNCSTLFSCVDSITAKAFFWEKETDDSEFPRVRVYPYRVRRK